jgi:hypothetical protein
MHHSAVSEVEEATTTQLPTVPLDGRRAGLLADLGAVTQDMKFVMHCCQRLVAGMADEQPDGVVMEALFTAAVITYARCFNTGKRSSLSENDLTKLGLEGDLRGFHRQVLDMRSKHVAHSVNPFEMITVGAVLSPTDAENRQVEGIAVLIVRHIAFDADGVTQLHEVCKRLVDRVIAARAEHLQAAALEEAREIAIDELYQRPHLRAQPPGPEAAGVPRV